LSPSPSRLQEAEKQSQALHQEVAELREELRARGPGGEWPELCSSLIVTKELL
jgi:serine/threonine-protein kinase MRCK